MNTKQYKNTFLRSKVIECLHHAQVAILMNMPAIGLRHCDVALAFARQLPPCSKHLALRAHIVAAQEALSNAHHWKAGTEQAFNPGTLDKLWMRVDRLKKHKDARRIRVYTEIATFEITET